MMRHAVGKPSALLVGAGHSLTRPLDVAGRDARREQPIIARPIDEILGINELDLDAIFQFEPAFVARSRGWDYAA
jgi:hypothetical protein